MWKIFHICIFHICIFFVKSVIKNRHVKYSLLLVSIFAHGLFHNMKHLFSWFFFAKLAFFERIMKLSIGLTFFNFCNVKNYHTLSIVTSNIACAALLIFVPDPNIPTAPMEFRWSHEYTNGFFISKNPFDELWKNVYLQKI